MSHTCYIGDKSGDLGGRDNRLLIETLRNQLIEVFEVDLYFKYFYDSMLDLIIQYSKKHAKDNNGNSFYSSGEEL